MNHSHDAGMLADKGDCKRCDALWHSPRPPAAPDPSLSPVWAILAILSTLWLVGTIVVVRAWS
jgi:hypothetical protein